MPKSAEEKFFGVEKAAGLVGEFHEASKARTTKGKVALGVVAAAGGVYTGGTVASVAGGAVLSYGAARGLLGTFRMVRRALKSRKSQ